MLRITIIDRPTKYGKEYLATFHCPYCNTWLINREISYLGTLCDNCFRKTVPLRPLITLNRARILWHKEKASE